LEGGEGLFCAITGKSVPTSSTTANETQSAALKVFDSVSILE
jgi:hypothetical protein